MKEKTTELTQKRVWDQFHSPDALAKSIVIEAAELLECFQWDSNYNKEEVSDELADVITYCFLLANKLDVDVEDIVLKKLEKTEKKYPISKSRGKSTKYNKLD